MAIVWVCHNRHETDPVKTIFFIARQSIAEKLANEWDLKTRYHITDHFLDLAIQGEWARVAEFLGDLADQYGIGGLIVDLEDGDDDCNIEDLEFGAPNKVANI